MALGQVTELRLGQSSPLIIGRSPWVDMYVDAPSVGRRAVSLTLEPEGVRIRDLGSGGGSLLESNGVAVHRPNCLLAGGAILAVGAVSFHLALISAVR